MYVETLASSPASGNIVRKPSKAALPGLSVTPALKPIVTVMSGDSVNSSELSKCKELVALSSIIGSANTSSTLEEISSEVISLSMRNPTIDLTLSISIEWSACSCLFTESPRTSLIPSPVFGVVSTRTMFEGTWNTCPLWGQQVGRDYRP